MKKKKVYLVRVYRTLSYLMKIEGDSPKYIREMVHSDIVYGTRNFKYLDEMHQSPSLHLSTFVDVLREDDKDFYR